MLGALLGSLFVAHTHPFPEDNMPEDVNEDTHWSGDNNRFEDWLLHPDADDVTDAEPFY